MRSPGAFRTEACALVRGDAAKASASPSCAGSQQPHPPAAPFRHRQRFSDTGSSFRRPRLFMKRRAPRLAPCASGDGWQRNFVFLGVVRFGNWSFWSFVAITRLSFQVKSRFTTGAASRSFTSTSFDPVTKNEYEYIKVEKNPTKKGYVQLHTTHGDLNIELHCDIAPRACENFITLCERGYYNGVAFHRSIRNFMIQGGDPTGTGRGGESIWGKPFKDEVNSKLLHSGRGVVSMANSGPHTNGSQFFILYKSANHLNFKHTVFGGVVGGMMTLTAMEKVPVDDNDKPLEEIKITGVTVFVNPYTELDEEEEKEKAKEEEAVNDKDKDKVGSWYSNPGALTSESGTAGGGGVGKYLKTARAGSSATADNGSNTDAVVKKRKVRASAGGGGFKDFSSW